MPTIDKNSVLWKEVDGKVVVLLLSSGTYCELNSIGSDIWKLLAEGHDKDAIVAELGKQYKVSAGQLGKDVDTFFERMVEQKLLEP